MKIKNKIAVFSCGNEEYVSQMCAALSLACKKNDFVPYIISDVDNPEKIELIHKLGITLLQVNLSEMFQVYNKNWPSHMFWYFIGPEALHKVGHKFSCYIDADVYCVNELDLSWLNDDIEIAARSDRDREFNSGVVFFNNEKMVEKKLFSVVCDAYKKCSEDKFLEWHGGLIHDQQILTALGNKNKFNDFWGGDVSFNILDLDSTWNYVFQHMKNRNENYINKEYSVLKDEVKFAHFLLSRPWLPFEKWGGQHGLFKTEDFPDGWVVKTNDGEPIRKTRIQFVKDWREEVRDIEGKHQIKLFGEFDELDHLVE